MSTSPVSAAPVLVTGVTGYIGGRLVPRLLAAGRPVVCMVRDPRKLDQRPWRSHPGATVVAGDVGDAAALDRALSGCGAAYYLVHSMLAAGSSYQRRDLELARAFAAGAERAGLERIVYLGGLGETGPDLSEHLRSRREVERALASGPVPVTVLRAAMIIGSGSASFEILRYLVERLPVMVTPRWVSTESQPIAVRNALGYLQESIWRPEVRGQTLDIGGPDVLPYRDIMQIMARNLGLRRRLVLPVPVLTPRLSSYWIHLVTPADHRIARPLAEGLRNRVVCRDDRAQRLMPQQLLTVDEAIAAALGGQADGDPESSWLDSGVLPGDPDWAGGTVYTDERAVEVDAPPERVFAQVCRLGGRHGWLTADSLWRLRGLLDRLVGGPGLARGRRRADRVGYGDVLDFWRVMEVVPGRRLLLRAEMRLPGEAELDFTVQPLADDRSLLTQTARFRPRGLAGLVYWFLVTPLHTPVFRGMLTGIRKRAEQSL
ncbi:MAG: SDR family oxidoreductase [Candidatus Krumholzibacteriia bacterium]